MKIFYRPYWIYLTVTLPHGLIILYYLNLYTIISSQFNPTNLVTWIIFGAALSLWMGSATLYAGIMQIRRGKIPWQYGIFAILCELAFIYLFYLKGSQWLLPASIQPWMLSESEALTLPIGMMMPSLIHALLLLVDRATPAGKKTSLIKTLIGTVTIPTIWYLAIRFLIPLMRGVLDWGILGHLLMVVFMILITSFMFLLMRLTYQLLLKLPQSDVRKCLAIKILVTLILPLACLLIYNGVVEFPGDKWITRFQFIGDWSHPVYYALVTVNGILLSLTDRLPPAMRFASFIAKAALYPIVTYFFIVFLPFFPFALSAIVLLGAGFLLLTPLLLFFFHTWSLYSDWSILRRQFGRRAPLSTLFTSILVIPTLVISSYINDRHTLDVMLQHLYEPDYKPQELFKLERKSADRVLKHIRMVKQENRFFNKESKPYLTSLYQWLVLDNLMLSERRLGDLERVFLGNPVTREKRTRITDREEEAPRITRVNTSTKLSANGRYFISQIDLEITHREEGSNFAEYATRFHLPGGAWISDYYLVIDNHRVPGILAEKRSALWIYQQVRNTNRDPGILYYTSPNELILRVFPFGAGETRQTGFELIHREAITLEIDSQKVRLQPDAHLAPRQMFTDDKEQFRMVQPSEKATLARYTRKPYLHFIVDCSISAKHRFSALSRQMEQLLEGQQLFGVGMEGAMVSFVNYDSLSLPLQPGWENQANQLEFEGGFFLELALKRALADTFRRRTDRYPLFVVVSDRIEQATFTSGMADFNIAMPEGDEFLLLQGTGEISLRRLSSPLKAIESPSVFSPASRQVLAWPDTSNPTAYLPDNGEASLVILKKDINYASLKPGSQRWENAVLLTAMWQLSKLDPSGAAEKHYALISNSFHTGLLTPMTAFLSPESELQRQLLYRKQQKMLASLRPLDIGEEYEMDEPPLWILLLFTASLILSRARHLLPLAGLTVTAANSEQLILEKPH